ncbi:MAG: hypothetical protein MMC33_000231 [Icmadophila ericetorum]|nr:hypothetical protein [Icmadophila ericetorum]
MEETGGIRTVKMASGKINIGNNPPRAMSTPSGRGAAIQRSTPLNGYSPDAKDIMSASQALSQVGITELLELDDRPTFIVDLGHHAIFQPGSLQVLLANASLRAFGGLLDQITGKANEDSLGLSSTFPEFKAWVLSFVKNGEALDIALPSFSYCGFMWTSSTLRKRLRIVIGSHPFGPTSISSDQRSSDAMVLRSAVSIRSKGTSLQDSQVTGAITEEPTDYFGAAAVSDTTSRSVHGGQAEKPETTTLKSLDIPTPFFQNTTSLTPQSEDRPGSDRRSPFDAGLNETTNGTIFNEALLSAATAAQIDAFRGPESMEQGFFDWTRLPVTPAMPRHVQFARSIDWAATSLGPIEHWPAPLRGMCNLIMASPHPAAMYWGDDNIAIYNEAYILLAGQKHPWLMGQSYEVVWSEIWFAVKDVFANARLTGQSTMKDDDQLFLRRSGYLEETYFSWSIIPLVGEDGSVVGLYNPAFEKTRRKIAERRMFTLREVGEKTAAAREVKGFWGQLLKALETNELDTPFVLLYSVKDGNDSDGSSMHSNSSSSVRQCMLEGALGVPAGHKAAPPEIDLRLGNEGFSQIFRDAMTTDKPILLETEKGTLDEQMLEGIEWRGFGDPCRAAVVCPIHPTTGESILGFLVMGINPRRPYDDDYNLFVQLLSRQLATSMASVVLFEEEIRRGQRAAKLAALDREELSEQLAARTQEAVESETKFTRMAELASVGMFIANSEGRIMYCNEAWYEISRHPKEENSADNWMESVKDEDKAKVKQLWNSLIEDKVPLNAEFRFKTPWADRNAIKGETWVLASAYPERHRDGSLKSIFGSITNISQQKWAEDFQKRRMEEAIELKRQQENFIDITSHEMRNPLSAILQCADEISTTLLEYRSKNSIKPVLSDLIESNIDAAQTITLCANHQKRIVDDILTLSKLDSALLLVTPVDVQPVTVVQRALKMFEGEFQTADINMEFTVEESLQTLNIDWIRLDPSRLLQVLINLTTNAIKFTTAQATRTIRVIVSALKQRPTSSDSTVTYFPTRSKRKDLTEGPDWGDGEEVFIHFAVQDTGRGLSNHEKKLLFQRFSQASPRTHVQYGGSGLGLFISRELVELQGGEIGVASESGKGSTFAFYVKARRSIAPIDAIDQLTPLGGNRKTSFGDKKTLSHGRTSSQDKVIPKDSVQSPPKSDLKVLIVEDNVVNQRVLQKQLLNLGCTVHLANHGGECLDFLKESIYWKGNESQGLDLNVILMDLEMPVMDGLTCAKKIRELQESGDVVRHIPIIAVTANARIEQIDTALGSGVDDVMPKPFRIPDLIPKIEALKKKYQIRVEVQRDCQPVIPDSKPDSA